jgi:hypothetical protein
MSSSVRDQTSAHRQKRMLPIVPSLAVFWRILSLWWRLRKPRWIPARLHQLQRS